MYSFCTCTLAIYIEQKVIFFTAIAVLLKLGNASHIVNFNFNGIRRSWTIVVNVARESEIPALHVHYISGETPDKIWNFPVHALMINHVLAS